MLYRSLDRIAAEADILTTPDLPRTSGLSRRERLERWAESLGREPGRRPRALHGIEYGTPYERLTCRADGSPLAVAYADPVLRAAGLEGTRSGTRPSSSTSRTSSCTTCSASATTGGQCRPRRRRRRSAPSRGKGTC